MHVGPASSSAVMGLAAAQRSMDTAAASFTAAIAAASGGADAPVASLGPSDPLDGVALGGDEVGAMVQMIAAQRAFTASLAVLKTEADMQRAAIDVAR